MTTSGVNGASSELTELMQSNIKTMKELQLVKDQLYEKTLSLQEASQKIKDLQTRLQVYHQIVASDRSDKLEFLRVMSTIENSNQAVLFYGRVVSGLDSLDGTTNSTLVTTSATPLIAATSSAVPTSSSSAKAVPTRVSESPVKVSTLQPAKVATVQPTNTETIQPTPQVTRTRPMSPDQLDTKKRKLDSSPDLKSVKTPIVTEKTIQMETVIESGSLPRPDLLTWQNIFSNFWPNSLSFLTGKKKSLISDGVETFLKSRVADYEESCKMIASNKHVFGIPEHLADDFMDFANELLDSDEKPKKKKIIVAKRTIGPPVQKQIKETPVQDSLLKKEFEKISQEQKQSEWDLVRFNKFIKSVVPSYSSLEDSRKKELKRSVKNILYDALGDVFEEKCVKVENESRTFGIPLIFLQSLTDSFMEIVRKNWPELEDDTLDDFTFD